MNADEILGHVRHFGELSRCAERADLTAVDRQLAGGKAEQVFDVIEQAIRGGGINTVPVEQFGEDHWSNLLAAEGAGRGYGGRLDPNLKRCNKARHPEEFAARTTRGDWYRPTVLKDGTAVAGHDDYDCLADLQAAGLLLRHGGTHRVTMTSLGLSVTAQLMGHMIDTDDFGSFDPDLTVQA